MSKHIERYLDQLRRNLRHMEEEERDAVIDEIGDHLQQEMQRLRAADPGLSAQAAAKKAIEAFGPAKDIGIAYGGSDEGLDVINQVTGELLLEVAATTGRVAGKVAGAGLKGLGQVAKWTLIAAISILGVAAIVTLAGALFAGQLIDTFQDDIRESVPRPLYGYHESWSGTTDAESSTTTERFDVRDGVKEFWISMELAADSGCGRIVLTDPSGDIRYDSDNVCGDDHVSRGFNFAEKGQWMIQYTYVGYTGSAEVEAWYFEDVDRST